MQTPPCRYVTILPALGKWHFDNVKGGTFVGSENEGGSPHVELIGMEVVDIVCCSIAYCVGVVAWSLVVCTR